MTGEELEDIVDRLLEVGIPPTAVGRAFGIDPLVVRDRLNDLRVERYGSAELAEATMQMQWDAFAQAKQLMFDAPYPVRTRFIGMILSKTMSLTARQTPETAATMRQQLMDLYQSSVGGGDDDLAGADPDAFVAVAQADEDQDEGSDG